MRPGASFIFLDANVLYSRTQRDWFCLISLESGLDGMAVCWSEDVLTEWLYHRRKKNPQLSDAEIGGLRRRLESSFPQATISGYSIDPMLLTGDPYDAHVLAASAHASVDYLVTNNISDFDEHAESFEFEIYTPDDMLCLIAERRPNTVLKTAKRQLDYWNQKPNSMPLPDALVAAGVPNFAEHVRKIIQQIALTGSY